MEMELELRVDLAKMVHLVDLVDLVILVYLDHLVDVGLRSLKRKKC